MNSCVANEPPTRVLSTGGILRWPDGRNMPDVHASLFEYGKYPVYLRLNAGCESPEIYRFQGSKGALEVTEFAINFTPQSGKDENPCYYTSSYPAAMRADYLKRWHAEHDVEAGKEPLAESYAYKGDSWDDLRPHLWNYFQHVRTGKPVVEDAVFGHNRRASPATWPMNLISAAPPSLGTLLPVQSNPEHTYA
jgi:hypothetical protein